MQILAAATRAHASSRPSPASRIPYLAQMRLANDYALTRHESLKTRPWPGSPGMCPLGDFKKFYQFPSATLLAVLLAKF